MADAPATTDAPSGQPAQQKSTGVSAEPELPKDYKPDPNDHSGDPLKVHDGSEKAAKEAGEEHAAGPTDKKGTGEQWVKSSGLQAEGGDFDAAKPGAGREATRLLEEKGIHHEPGVPGAPVASSEGPAKTDKGDKPSVVNKIKGVLH
ncbi:MAG: hypothetical protein M1814_006043 [Vezdaea aestivalis]|nr:MAG: hypothetical protein M1814_006043 [Vezdaea aestivalis]